MACRTFRWGIAEILCLEGFKPRYQIPDSWWNDYHAGCNHPGPDIRVSSEDCQAKRHGFAGCQPWQGLDGYYLWWSGISWRHQSCLIIDIFLSYYFQSCLIIDIYHYLISFIFSFFWLLFFYIVIVFMIIKYYNN